MPSPAWLFAPSFMDTMLDQDWRCELQFVRMEIFLNEVMLMRKIISAIIYEYIKDKVMTRQLRGENRYRLMIFFFYKSHKTEKSVLIFF